MTSLNHLRSAAVGILLSATSLVASAGLYQFTGSMEYVDAYDHGSIGTFDFTLETSGPVGSGYTDVIGITGTFFGKNIIGLNTLTGSSSLYKNDNKVSNGTVNEIFGQWGSGGLGFIFEDLGGSNFAGQKDNVVLFNYWTDGSGVRSLYATIGTTAVLNNYSSDYIVTSIVTPSGFFHQPPAAVSEPATAAVVLAGLGLMGLASRRKTSRMS